MSNRDNFAEIKPIWLERVSNRLAAVEGIQKCFAMQLAELFDALLDSISDDSINKLIPILQEWINARTESASDPSENSVRSILSQIVLITFDIVKEIFAPNVALDMIGEVLPLYSSALEYVGSYETKLDLQYMTEELKRTRFNLEKLEASKSDFISIAAHELRTPLTLIEGYASMLDDVTSTDRQRDQTGVCLAGIKAGTMRLREIVDDMIDVSMIENSLLTLNYQPIWLNRLLNQICREVNSTVLERRLKFDVASFSGSDEMIFADGERLYQAFKNVVTNAIKYTPDGGKITIDGRLLPGFIEIIFSDTGIGIDPEDHLRIFEKFGRLGNVSLHSSGKLKFKGGGPGLGLPITKGIIEAHGGSIWVESARFDEEHCPGSVFHILIPIRKMPPDEGAAKLFHPLVTNS